MKSSMITVAAFAALATSTATVFAVGTPVGQVKMYDSYGSTAGGEFRAVAQSGFTITPSRTGTAFEGSVAAAVGSFETFCVEKFENISLSGTTYNAAVNTTTVSSNSNYNSGGHGGSADALDARTAYLYTHFINMDLVTSYNYVNATTRATDANALQTAIWFIEQEDSTALTGKALTLYNEANNAVNSGAWTGLGNVKILNLTTTGGANAQDQLIMTGSTTVTIPLPTTAALAGAGLVGMGLRRRR